MKIAVISPIPLLEKYTVLGDRYHLILSHLAVQNQKYREFYKQRVQQGDFVILDNSAHEFGVGRDGNSLIQIASEIGVQELVLPDRLFFGDDTLELSREAMRIIKKKLPWVRCMGVPQGRTLEEYMVCLRGLTRLGVDTIGISKDYEVWPGGIAGMVAYTNLVAPHVDIHLLGWGRNLQSLCEIASYQTLRVRGIDSAKPLVYATQGVRLPLNPRLEIPKYPGRCDNFFDLTDRDVDEDIARWNIQVFKVWARGEKGDSWTEREGVEEYDGSFSYWD